MTQITQTTIETIVAARRRGVGYPAIAAMLNADGVLSARGGRWHGGTVRAVVLANDPNAAQVAAHRHVTEEGVVYECALCGRVSPGAEMIVSTHTGNRYCGTKVDECHAKRRAIVAAEREAQAVAS
jgi:hypothetical protein